MKVKGFLIALIGMIGLTAFATTSEPEQKQNPVFTDPPIELVYTANVENHNVEIVMVLTSNQSVITQVLRKKNEVLPFVAIITDVGWQFEKQISIIIPHKEQLQTDYVIDKRKLINSLGVRENRNSC